MLSFWSYYVHVCNNIVMKYVSTNQLILKEDSLEERNENSRLGLLFVQ